MKKILCLSLMAGILLFQSCDLFEPEKEPDYIDCKWLGYKDPIPGMPWHYGWYYARAGYKGPSFYTPNVTDLKWIHLYKEDKYSEMKKSSGSNFIVDLTGKNYTYEKL